MPILHLPAIMSEELPEETVERLLSHRIQEMLHREFRPVEMESEELQVLMRLTELWK